MMMMGDDARSRGDQQGAGKSDGIVERRLAVGSETRERKVWGGLMQTTGPLRCGVESGTFGIGERLKPGAASKNPQ
jgi:hypothetical protein